MTTTTIASGRSRDLVPGCLEGREAQIDLALHLIGLAAAAIGCSLLLPMGAVSDSIAYSVGLVLYSIGLFSMLVCSALYNGWTTAKCRHLLRRMDQSAIFLLIAGTYSPFMTAAIDDPTVAIVYGAVCLISATGLVGLFVFPQLVDKVYPWIYLVLGWAIVVALEPLSERLPPTVLGLIFAGGLLYTVGMYFHQRERRYDTAIWHAFVLAAAGCHYAAVYVTAPLA